MTDSVGQRFGDYRIIRLVGRGSFGDVYLGEHIYEKTSAAIKILKTVATSNDELKQFINEARTFRLKHPNIVQLLDFGIEADGSPFLVMDYAPNGTLRNVIQLAHDFQFRLSRNISSKLLRLYNMLTITDLFTEMSSQKIC